MMIPRFSNPHVQLERTQVVSRKQLREEEGAASYFAPDPSLVDDFNVLMKRALPQFDSKERKRKRRKLGFEEEEVREKEVKSEPILYRLISNGPPILVSLVPPPQIPIKAKQPESEDTEAQAIQRQEQALAVAVTADWVMQEARKVNRHPTTRSPVTHVALPSASTLAPPILVLQYNKPVRKTRPPVDTKLGYPYDACAKPEPLETTAREFPVIDLNRSLEDVTTEDKRTRRRQRNMKKIEHKFWRPDPSVKGKCMGYAMGY